MLILNFLLKINHIGRYSMCYLCYDSKASWACIMHLNEEDSHKSVAFKK